MPFHIQLAPLRYGFGPPTKKLPEIADLFWAGEFKAQFTATIGTMELQLVAFAGFTVRDGKFDMSPLMANAPFKLSAGGIALEGDIYLMYPCNDGSVAMARGVLSLAGLDVALLPEIDIHFRARYVCGDVPDGENLITLDVKFDFRKNAVGAFTR